MRKKCVRVFRRNFYSTGTKRLGDFQTGTTFYLGIVNYLVFYTEKPFRMNLRLLIVVICE